MDGKQHCKGGTKAVGLDRDLVNKNGLDTVIFGPTNMALDQVLVDNEGVGPEFQAHLEP